MAPIRECEPCRATYSGVESGRARLAGRSLADANAGTTALLFHSRMSAHSPTTAWERAAPVLCSGAKRLHSRAALLRRAIAYWLSRTFLVAA